MGWLDPDQMLAAMPARLWAEWQALSRIEPWDEQRGDLRMGIICSMLDACHRVTGTVPRPERFMPYIEKPRSGQGQAEMKAAFKQAKAGFAARAGKPAQPERDGE